MLEVETISQEEKENKIQNQTPQEQSVQKSFNRNKREFNNSILEYKKPKNKGDIVSKNKMIEAKVYFGKKTALWHPKMKPYILITKKRIHIIDIKKTKKALEFAYMLINKFAQKRANFIFVGTKKQAKATIKENALRTKSAYVSERWLGGMLTNNRTIFQRVRRMNSLERLQENNFEGYTKKEGIIFSKELAKLQKNLYGIKNMRSKPNIMIIADPKIDEIAVKEAKKLGIKIIGIVNTDADPTIVDVAIPANYDSIKSITLIITILADAIIQAQGGAMKFAYQLDDEIILPMELRTTKNSRNKFNNRASKFISKNIKNFTKNVTTNDKKITSTKVEINPSKKELKLDPKLSKSSTKESAK